jgi:glycosyltransferase involved in cell wall biosynthesis
MRVVLFANTDWFLYNFKLALARALRERGDEVVLVSPPGPYGEKLRAQGFRWEPFAFSRSGVNPLAEWSAIRGIAALYRQIAPDVVHHFTIKCVIYGSFAARQAGVPRIVNSVTGLGFALLADTLKARLIRPVVVALYRRALAGTRVVFQNCDNLATLRALGALDQAQVCVIPGDGVDVARFCPPPERPFAQTVLMMGRLLHSKGVGEFVAAAALVRAELPSARLLLAGDPDPGNPESVDETTLAQWRAAGHVEFLGHRSDVVALQQACDIAVLASTQGEGMPRALLEAAACGRALVATDVPGSRELVSDGVNGLLVPPGDVPALAQAMLALLKDPQRCQNMGQLARERVLRDLSDQRICEQTLALYEESTPKPSHNPPYQAPQN